MEQFIKGKRNLPELCEDGVFVGRSLIAVIDGCTSKGDLMWEGSTSGRFAKDCILDLLSRNDKWDSASDFFTVLANLFYEKRNIHKNCKREDWPRACVIAYSSAHQQVWSYGDCQCMINGFLHSHSKRIDSVLSNIRADVIEAAISAEGESEIFAKLTERDFGRAAIKDKLRGQLRFENKHLFIHGVDFGYPVINGEPICKDMIKVYDVSEGDDVILATDGYPEVMSTLQQSEQRLHEILEEDPFCFRIYKSTKGLQQGCCSFDDRAWVKFTV